MLYPLSSSVLLVLVGSLIVVHKSNSSESLQRGTSNPRLSRPKKVVRFFKRLGYGDLPGMEGDVCESHVDCELKLNCIEKRCVAKFNPSAPRGQLGARCVSDDECGSSNELGAFLHCYNGKCRKTKHDPNVRYKELSPDSLLTATRSAKVVKFETHGWPCKSDAECHFSKERNTQLYCIKKMCRESLSEVNEVYKKHSPDSLLDATRSPSDVYFRFSNREVCLSDDDCPYSQKLRTQLRCYKRKCIESIEYRTMGYNLHSPNSLSLLTATRTSKVTFDETVIDLDFPLPGEEPFHAGNVFYPPSVTEKVKAVKGILKETLS